MEAQVSFQFSQKVEQNSFATLDALNEVTSFRKQGRKEKREIYSSIRSPTNSCTKQKIVYTEPGNFQWAGGKAHSPHCPPPTRLHWSEGSNRHP